MIEITRMKSSQAVIRILRLFVFFAILNEHEMNMASINEPLYQKTNNLDM